MPGTALIPFAEPAWISGLPSAYHTESHRNWQKKCREFIQQHLIDNALEWDSIDTLPDTVFKTFAEHHMLLPSLPAPLPVEWLHRLGIRDLLGVLKVEDFDYIHCAIFTDEVS